MQILFADASTGSRSPALVHQGRIGEIIQAKPEQRRRVLEEAAGISGLHARRHEAELRLRAAEHNLQRLEDVIGQLAGADRRSLKRQARQAIRYRNVSGQVRKAEATLFHLRWVAANTEVAEAEHAKDFERAHGRRAHRRAGGGGDSARRPPRLNCRRCARRKPGPRPACSGSTSRARLWSEEETRAKERIAELDRRIIQLGHDIERERQLAADAEAALARLAAEEEILRAGGARKRRAAKPASTKGPPTPAPRSPRSRTRLPSSPPRSPTSPPVAISCTPPPASYAERMTRLRPRSPRSIPSWTDCRPQRRTAVTISALAAAVDDAQVALREAEAAYQDAEAAHSDARHGAGGRPHASRRR